MQKHCPNCRHLLVLEHGDKSGVCGRCGKDFEIKYKLTKIRLVKVEEVIDYNLCVLKYIEKKEKTYANEIFRSLRFSKGCINRSLKELEYAGLINISAKGKTKWVTFVKNEHPEG